MPVIWPLLAMMLVQAMTMLAVVTVPVLAPVLSLDLGVDSALIGIYQSSVFAGATVLTLFSGSLVRRHGGVRVNQISLVIAVAALLVALDGRTETLLACALGVGMGYGLATPGASHVLARVSPVARRGLVFSLKQSAVPVGGLIAGLLIPPVSEAFGWRAALITVAAIIAFAIIAVQPLRARIDDDRDSNYQVSAAAPWQSIVLVLRTPALRPVALVAFTFGAIQLCLFAFLVTFLVERVALTLVVAGTVFAVMQGVGVVARIFWGWLSDRAATSRTLLSLIGIGIVVSTMTANEMGPGWPLLAVISVSAVMGATAVGWNGIYLAEVARVVPQERVGAATGGVLMFTFLGIVAGPSTFGLLVQYTGQYTAGFALMNFLVAIAVLMLLLGKDQVAIQTVDED
jgi:MFS family permease